MVNPHTDTCDMCGGALEPTDGAEACTCTCCCDRTCDQCWDCTGIDCPCDFDTPHELTPRQAAWIEPLRASLEAHPARVPTCPGCALFGLCALHDSPDMPPHCPGSLDADPPPEADR